MESTRSCRYPRCEPPVLRESLSVLDGSESGKEGGSVEKGGHSKKFGNVCFNRNELKHHSQYASEALSYIHYSNLSSAARQV